MYVSCTTETTLYRMSKSVHRECALHARLFDRSYIACKPASTTHALENNYNPSSQPQNNSLTDFSYKTSACPANDSTSVKRLDTARLQLLDSVRHCLILPLRVAVVPVRVLPVSFKAMAMTRSTGEECVAGA
jgi:hypothetical protein